MKKYWFGLIIFIVLGLLFIYKDSSYIKEKVYVIYKKDKQFYKNKYGDIFYYQKKEQILELVSFKNKKVEQKKYQKIKSLNII
jgi:hypothetical protein